MVTFKPSGPVRLLRLWPPAAKAGPTCLVLVTRPAPRPATLRRPPSSVGRRVIPKAHPSSHPSCHSQSLVGLQLRGHTWAWLPHMPRCRVESGRKPLHALVGIWGVGQEGRVPAGLTTPGALAAPFPFWVLLRRGVTRQPASLLEFSQMLTGPLCPWDLLGLRLGSLR